MNDLVAEPLSQVRSERLTWLWDRWLPRGKLTLLDGDPGIGKSLVTLDLAARLTRGHALPGGTPSGRPHTVLLLAAKTTPRTRPAPVPKPPAPTSTASSHSTAPISTRFSSPIRCRNSPK